MMKSNISEEFAKITLKTVQPRNDEQKTYIERLKKVTLSKDAPWCLIVSGTKGNGKSYIAQVAVNTFNVCRFEGALYTTQPIIQYELWDDSVSNGEIFFKYAYAPMLVIDELSDRPKDWTEFIKTTIENILIERHRLHLKTVLIGNVALKNIGQMFDVRVRDRLKEGLRMVMNEDSMRKENEND